MNERIKYRFEILYQTPNLKQASDFLGKLDLGINEFCFKEVITFTYTKQEKPISYFKELIHHSMKETGYIPIKIEGGKIE